MRGKIKKYEEKGSYFTEKDRSFLLKQYQEIVHTENPYNTWKRKIEEYVKEYEEKKDFVKYITFSIATTKREYFYHRDDATLFDLASITKLFTMHLIYELDRQNILSIHDQVGKYIEDIHLHDFTLLDILQMKGKIETDVWLNETHSLEAFLEGLYTLHTVSTNQKAIYCDMGFVLLRFIVEKVLLDMSFEEAMKKYVLSKYQLEDITFNPNVRKYKTLGNGNQNGLCHDPKTRIINGVSGSAGLFANLKDLHQYIKELLQYKCFDQTFINEIYQYLFYDAKCRNRSYAGLYTKSKDDIASYAPYLYSNKTLAMQGYTGSVCVMDFEYGFENIILVDAVDENTGSKSDLFLEYFKEFQKKSHFLLFC